MPVLRAVFRLAALRLVCSGFITTKKNIRVTHFRPVPAALPGQWWTGRTALKCVPRLQNWLH